MNERNAVFVSRAEIAAVRAEGIAEGRAAEAATWQARVERLEKVCRLLIAPCDRDEACIFCGGWEDESGHDPSCPVPSARAALAGEPEGKP